MCLNKRHWAFADSSCPGGGCATGRGGGRSVAGAGLRRGSPANEFAAMTPQCRPSPTARTAIGSVHRSVVESVEASFGERSEPRRGLPLSQRRL